MIQQIQIDKIQFDKTQPRKFIDQKKVKEMALSILTQGVINPIEIDKDFKIVTGELRYRASMEAELRTVPCKVIEISDKERFERQVIENVHHNTMSDWDTAKALEKLVNCYQVTDKDKGISYLSNRTGKSREWINEKLGLLDTSIEFQKAIQNKEISGTMIRAVRRIPKEYKKEFEEKIAKGDFNNREVAITFADSIMENPDKASELFKMDFRNKSAQEAQKEIQTIAPTIQNKANNLNDYLEQIESMASKLNHYLKNPPEGLDIKGGLLQFNAKLAITNLSQLHQTLNKFFISLPKLNESPKDIG